MKTLLFYMELENITSQIIVEMSSPFKKKIFIFKGNIELTFLFSFIILDGIVHLNLI